MPYRCDFYSDEEYEQACAWQEEEIKRENAMREYEESCAYETYLKEIGAI